MHLLAGLRAALERDHATLSTELAALVELATKHRMSLWFDGFTDVFSVWAAMDSTQPKGQEIARCMRGIDKLETTGQRLFLPFFMARLATGLSTCERHDEALRMIDRASTMCRETAQGWCDAELWRVRGELLSRAAQHDRSQASHCFTKALALARSGGIKLWELRAAVSLARLKAHQGQQPDALNVLMPVYESFTEGFDCVDLAEARAQLSEFGYCVSSARS
jgi:predicted ATPase